MQVAIFSDVHGNLTALDAVLADIKKQTPDIIFFAGDLCLSGPRPAECLERVRQANISAIYGNTDLTLTNQPLLSDDIQAEKKEREQEIDGIVDWTRAQLNEGQSAWLYSLPFHRRVSPTPDPKDDLFIVHANPQNVDDGILPSEAKQKLIYGEIKQPDNDSNLSHLLKNLAGGILAFGHVHIPDVRHWGNLTLANISSVSQPQDGDPRAKYGLFSWDRDDGWFIEHRYVAYDVEEEMRWYERQRLPGWESYIERLEAVRP